MDLGILGVNGPQCGAEEGSNPGVSHEDDGDVGAGRPRAKVRAAEGLDGPAALRVPDAVPGRVAARAEAAGAVAHGVELAQLSRLQQHGQDGHVACPAEETHLGRMVSSFQKESFGLLDVITATLTFHPSNLVEKSPPQC